MDAYIRFQCRLRCRYTGRPIGIFVAAGRVQDRKGVPESTQEMLGDAISWFNQNLRVPALDDDQWRCLFWFRSGSQEIIRRLWELTYLLQDEGIFIQKVRTCDPGRVIYQDEHQVAAVPGRRSIALRHHAVGRMAED